MSRSKSPATPSDRGSNRSIQVHFESQKVSVSSDACLSFTEFDSWVRSRFALVEGSCRYLDKQQREVIPCGKFLSSRDNGGKVFVEWVKDGGSGSMDELEAEKKRKKSLVGSPPPNSYLVGTIARPVSETFLTTAYAWELFVTLGPYVLSFGLLIALSPLLLNQEQSQSDGSNVVAGMLDHVLDATHLFTWKPLILETYVNALAWSVTYLFIRRWLNPENGAGGEAFQRYGADAWFGGLSVAVSVLLKKVLNHAFSL